jgi:hypothetical protein
MYMQLPDIYDAGDEELLAAAKHLQDVTFSGSECEHSRYSVRRLHITHESLKG